MLDKNIALDTAPFVSVANMMNLVHDVGFDRFVTELAEEIADAFRRWPVFDKTPRVAAHSKDGVIDPMVWLTGSNM